MFGSMYTKAALFVDFDNIYIGLEKQQREAAMLFAKNPDRWVRWLEREAPGIGGGAGQAASERRILARRCYINPRAFQDFRPHFIRSAFEVVDCPPLTSSGKTSADVYMVIDMLDALQHQTIFDEFIVLSGDADFTPVLLRLRKYDRRTMILSVGPASSAYKASSDLVLDESLFLEKGLGIGANGNGSRAKAARPAPSRSGKVLKKIASKLEEFANLTGRVESVELIGIYKEFPEFAQGENWLGFHSLRKMTEAVVATSSAIEIVDGDSWWVRAVNRSRSDFQAKKESELPGREAIAEVVRKIVGESESAVVLGLAAQKITAELGDAARGSNWLGAGSFKGLLEELDLGPLKVSSKIPGYVFDPTRHESPGGSDESGSPSDLDLPSIAEKISSFTDTPKHSSSTYAVLFRQIAKEVNESGYHLTETSKAVRDRCVGKGLPVPRSSASFLLKAVVFAGHQFKKGKETPRRLGEIFYENTLELCQRAQVDLTTEEENQVRSWILGDIGTD